jgi:hypothetical protein
MKWYRYALNGICNRMPSPYPIPAKKKCASKRIRKRLFRFNLTETEVMSLFKKTSFPVT